MLICFICNLAHLCPSYIPFTSGSILERHWGTKQYAIFLAVAIFAPIITTTLIYIFLYALQSDVLYLQVSLTWA